MKRFEARLNRILPLEPRAFSKNLSDEDVRVEAEKMCKPFCCIVQGCLVPRTRSPEQEQICYFASADLQMCVNRISEEIIKIIR